MRNSALLAAAVLTASATAGAQKRALTFDDFSAVRAVGDPQPSPDGKSILYAVRTTDVSANRRVSLTFFVPSNGGSPQVFPSQTVSATEARWSPDGKRIAYIASGQTLDRGRRWNQHKTTHASERRSNRPHMVADRRPDRIHVGCLSRLLDRCVQRRQGQGCVRQQSQSPHR